MTAELRLPQDRPILGTVVILHGGTGISELEQADQADLARRGFATVLIDSFTGRGFSPGPAGGAGARLRASERAAEAYSVLNTIRKHPELTQKPIILFGRSHGASAALVAATAWAKDTHGPTAPGYDGVIALYPACATYPEQLRAVAPIRLHLAMADQLTPAAFCITAADRMKAAGVDVRVTRYAHAHHGFDSPHPVQYFGTWPTMAKCNITLSSVTAPLPQDQMQACASRGASIGRHEQAASEFLKNRAAELAEFSATPGGK